MVRVGYSNKSSYVKGTGIESTCIVGIYAKKACTKSIYTGSTYTRGACTRVISNKGISVRSVYAIEHSKMHL